MTQKTITKKFIIALAAIAVLAAADNLLLASHIRLAESTTKIIDVSGRQRMLSQRTVYLATIIVSDIVKARRKIAARDLATVVDELERTHELLVAPEADNVLAAGMSEALLSIYFEAPFQLDKKTRDHAAAARELLVKPLDQLAGESILIRDMMDSAAPLLAAQEAAVTQYQIE